jgi:membrane-associated phospholipid phosphatase
MNNQLNYKNFAIAAIITAIASLLLFYCSYVIGKNQLFLLLNNDYGTIADFFFNCWTYLGDGAVWAVLLFVFIKYSKQNIPLLVAAFVICTLLVQVCKYIIVPDELRPVSVIQPTSLIHMVKGVEPHETASFPSGHTSAAFSFFLIGCLLINKKWIIAIGFIYAILVGYSRIYLAQHFPFDVAAGMLVGIITVALSILTQQWFNKRKSKNAQV